MMRAFDRKAVGTMRWREFRHALRGAGIILDEEETVELFEAFDRDNAGFIDYEEFCALFDGHSNVHEAHMRDLVSRRRVAQGWAGRDGKHESAAHQNAGAVENASRDLLRGHGSAAYLVFRKVAARFYELDIDAQTVMNLVERRHSRIVEYREFSMGLRRLNVFLCEDDVR